MNQRAQIADVECLFLWWFHGVMEEEEQRNLVTQRTRFGASTHVPAPPVGRVFFRAPRAKTPGNKVNTPFSGDLLA